MSKYNYSKYEKPDIKKPVIKTPTVIGHAELQFEFEKIIFIAPVARDENFYKKYRAIADKIKKESPELLQSLKTKYQDKIDPLMNQ